MTSLFKAKDGQVENSSAPSAPPAPGQPLSYAEFVVQSKNRALQGAAHGPEKQSRSDAAGQSNVNTAGIASVSTSSTDSGKPETEQQGPEEVPTDDQTKEESQSSESCIIPPHLLGSGNSIIVSPRQVCTVCSIRQCSVFSRYIYRKKETVKYIHANMCQYKHPNRIKNVLNVTFCWFPLNNMQV